MDESVDPIEIDADQVKHEIHQSEQQEILIDQHRDITLPQQPQPARVREQNRTGLGAVPIVGPLLDRTRQVFDGLQPQVSDSLGITMGKRSLQGAVIVGTAAAAAVCVL